MVDNNTSQNNKINYVMDWKVMIPTLLTSGIFLIGFLSLLLVSFNAMLNPIRKDIGRLDTDIKATSQELKATNQELKATKQELKATKQELKADIKLVNDKLDQLIVTVAKIENKIR